MLFFFFLFSPFMLLLLCRHVLYQYHCQEKDRERNSKETTIVVVFIY